MTASTPPAAKAGLSNMKMKVRDVMAQGLQILDKPKGENVLRGKSDVPKHVERKQIFSPSFTDGFKRTIMQAF